LGQTNSKEQLKRSKRFQGEATKAILAGIEERRQQDALLSRDRDILQSVIGELAELMVTAKDLGAGRVVPSIDPNDWADEVGNPCYIVDLIGKVTRVAMETVQIVDGLDSNTGA